MSDGTPITVIVAGEPVAKARPRATRRGIIYTPAHVKKYEAHVRLAAQLAMSGPPIAGPVRAEVVIDLPVPTSWSLKRQAAALAGEIRPTSRPDIDNFVKAGMDAINTIVIVDDCLLVELVAFKRYSRIPQLKIVISPFPGAAAAQSKKKTPIGDSAAADLLEHAGEGGPVS